MYRTGTCTVPVHSSRTIIDSFHMNGFLNKYIVFLCLCVGHKFVTPFLPTFFLYVPVTYISLKLKNTVEQ